MNSHIVEAIESIEDSLLHGMGETLGLGVIYYSCGCAVELPCARLLENGLGLSNKDAPECSEDKKKDIAEMKAFLISELDAYAAKLKRAVGILRKEKKDG